MRRIKLWCALAAVVLALLTVPAMAEDTVPYPARTILYIVDCSGSMKDYKEALDTGRQMLLDLLPEETTTVVAFKSQAYTPGDTLTFGGETSVLSGITRADEVLEELWAKNPDQEITAVLFSDMYSTVAADDGVTPLTEASARAENERLAGIAGRWNEYTASDKLCVYSLGRVPAAAEDKPDGFPMSFIVLPPPSMNAVDRGTGAVGFSSEILKLCAEVYAGVLTGSDGMEWEEVQGTRLDGSLTLPLPERYREFLFLDEVPSGAVGPAGETLPCWALPDGCVLMVEGGTGGTCSIDGVTDGVSVQSLVIPQPRIEVDFSESPVTVFEPVTISVAVTNGRDYLGYDGSNSVCLMKVTAPGEETPRTLPSDYSEDRNGYEFTYTAEVPGNHLFEVTYIVLGEEPVTRTLQVEEEAAVRFPEPEGYRYREYQDLSGRLQKMTVGDEISFELAGYYTDQNIRLEFAVQSPADPETAVWEAAADQTGAVTVRGLQAGTTTLRYTVEGYIDGMEEPCCTADYELTVSVSSPPGPVPPIVWKAGIPALLVVLIIVIWVTVHRIRKKKREEAERAKEDMDDADRREKRPDR